MSVVNFVGEDEVCGRVFDLVKGLGVGRTSYRKANGDDDYYALVMLQEDFSPALELMEKTLLQIGIEQAATLKKRGEAALELAEMALKHGGGGASAAARLLLAMQYEGHGFNFLDLVRLDAGNRALANTLMIGVRGGDFLPSNWITCDTDKDGQEIMEALLSKWGD